MAMNTTRITSVDYLQSTVMNMDGAAPTALTGTGLTAYYTDPGNPPGRWIGSGSSGLDVTAGEIINSRDAVSLWQKFRHPKTQARLGRPPRSERKNSGAANDNQLAETSKQQKGDVAGFDLTFTIPKDASILWALGDPELQTRIAQCHTRAISQALQYVEAEVAQTRVGHAGVGSAAIAGIIGGQWDHWDTRDGDPHLHSHVVLSNRVQRASDGAWVTLDSRALFKQTVAISELHQNLFMDELHRELGVEWRERTAVGSNAAVPDIVGMPDLLRTLFSGRRTSITNELAQWTRQFRKERGREPHESERFAFSQAAWRATRKAKDKSIAPLAQRCSEWRDVAHENGYDVPSIVGECLNRETPADITAATSTSVHDVIAQLALGTIADAQDRSDTARVAATASALLNRLERSHSTWTEANIRAEIQRTMRFVRASSPDVRTAATELVTEAVLAQCIAITPTRYRVDTDDPRLAINGRSIFDDPHRATWTSRAVLEREQALLVAATSADATVAPLPDEISALVESISDAQLRERGFGLAEDQADAVRGILADTTRISVLVGPAGTGKTTTMSALHAAWDLLHGKEMVTGLTTSAQAAHVLGTELDAPAHTIAKWLHETTIGNDRRLEQRAAAHAALNNLPADAPHHVHAQLTRELARLTAQIDTWSMKPGQLIIVDEASMTETAHLAALTAQADQAGAKLLLVGDHRQLDAVEAGGALAMLAHTPSAHELTSVWRFEEAWEAEASLALRHVHDTAEAEAVLATYDEHQRILPAEDDTALQDAYEATREALSTGSTAIIIAATNSVVSDINARFVDDRRAAGIVSTDRLVALRGGADAGTGERILARTNDRRLRDDSNDFIRNGTIMTIARIHADGSVDAIREDSGAAIRLPADYLALHCELGYATTAHRCQGVTVDEARLVIPSTDAIPAELLYVGMTRGRTYNGLHIGTPGGEPSNEAASNDPQEPSEELTSHEMVDGVVLATPTASSWRERLVGMLQTSGGEVAATTAIERAEADADSLSRLIYEYEYLASLEDTEHLASAASRTTGLPADELESSPVFSSLAAAWRTANALDPRATEAALSAPLRGIPTGADAATQLRLLTSRLRRIDVPITDSPLIAGITPAITDRADPEVRDLAAQVHRRITTRIRTITMRAADHAWSDGLSPDTIRAIAVYRDLYDVRSPSAVGPAPTARDTRQLAHWSTLTHLIAEDRRHSQPDLTDAIPPYRPTVVPPNEAVAPGPHAPLTPTTPQRLSRPHG